MKPVAIVGGGISGLATAWYLTRLGVPAVIFEKEPRTGGLIHTEVVEDCQIEWGPDSFLATKTAARELIDELGLADQLVSSAAHRRTYLWNGRMLVPIPEGMQLIAPTRLGPILSTPLFGWQTKMRMALERFRKPPEVPLPDRSVSVFVSDHYGREAAEMIAEPLMAGVYGGFPELLSVQSVLPKMVEYESHYGSLTRGAMANRGAGPKGGLFQTLRAGMGQLTDTLAAKLAPAVGIVPTTATSIQPRAQVWIVEGQGSGAVEASAVVLACRAWQAAPLVKGFAPALAQDLGAIPYSSAITVALGYRRGSIAHALDGFGFLVPRKFRKSILACTWVGSKWPHRVPQDLAVLRCFLNGGEDYVRNTPEDLIIEACRTDLKEIMGVVTDDPLFVRVNRWPLSMPQYEVGHKQLIERVITQLEDHPGLFLAGNAYDGVGVPDCIRWAKTAANQAAARHNLVIQ